MKNQIYNIASRKCWYNPISKIISNKRVSKSDIKFDSKAEFDLYLDLEAICSPRNIHIYKDVKIDIGCKWLIDFKLVFPLNYLDRVNELLTHLNKKSTQLEIPIIYLEFKGMHTSASNKKLELLVNHPMNEKVVMISYDSNSFCLEDKENLEIISKPIYSRQFFMLSFSRYVL